MAARDIECGHRGKGHQTIPATKTPSSGCGVSADFCARGATRDEVAGNQQSPTGRLFVATSGDEVVGSVMAGYDGRRGWINYLAVQSTHRRRGLGTTLMQTAEGYLAELECPKVNLQVRESNPDVVAFYVALGYMDDHVMSMGKRLG